MIGKIDNNQIQDILKESSSQQNEPPGISANNEVDASLQLSYDSLIEKAMQIPQADTNAVQQAQELLLSGQLESPENIRAAAQNIINLGI